MRQPPPPPPGESIDEPAEPVFDFTPKSEPDAAVGTTEGAGRTEDEGKGRVFPCPSCGADLVFHIGQQAMKCPYCGYEEAIVLPAEAEVKERDFDEMLRSLREHHDKDRHSYEGMKELRCGSCGGTVVFQGSLTSSACPYCASPIQIDRAEQAKDRIAVDGVLPFLVDHDKAARNLAAWVKSRWFAPNEFKKYSELGSFRSVYASYFTFDASANTDYTGERGTTYTVTVGSGDNRHTETRVRWTYVRGRVHNSFDDLPILANTGLDETKVAALEPWPTERARPYSAEYVAGHLARTYDRTAEQCFEPARQRMEGEIDRTVRRDIGGDRQRVHSQNIQWYDMRFKYLLMPIWLLTVIYEGKPFQVCINGVTGEVQGRRPISKIKVAFAVLVALIVIVGVVILYQSRGG